MPHTVIVILEAKPTERENLRRALEKVVAPSRAEDSNIDYRLHESTENPNEFILYENWASAALHQEQFQKPYIKRFIQETENMLAKPYQLHIAQELEPCLAGQHPYR